MQDLNPHSLQIQISHDGKTVWINTENGCVLRASGVKMIQLDDARIKDENDKEAQ